MAMRVAQILIWERAEREIVEIDQDETGRRTEMTVDEALQSVIFSDRNTEMHGGIFLSALTFGAKIGR